MIEQIHSNELPKESDLNLSSDKKFSVAEDDDKKPISKEFGLELDRLRKIYKKLIEELDEAGIEETEYFSKLDEISSENPHSVSTSNPPRSRVTA